MSLPPNAPPRSKDGDLGRLARSETSYPERIKIIRTKDPVLCRWVVQNPDLTEEELLLLLDMPGESWRAQIAHREDLPSSVREKILRNATTITSIAMFYEDSDRDEGLSAQEIDILVGRFCDPSDVNQGGGLQPVSPQLSGHTIKDITRVLACEASEISEPALRVMFEMADDLYVRSALASRHDFPVSFLESSAKDFADYPLSAAVLFNPGFKPDASYPLALLLEAEDTFYDVGSIHRSLGHGFDLTATKNNLTGIIDIVNSVRSQIRPDFWDTFAFSWEGTADEFVEYSRMLDN